MISGDFLSSPLFFFFLLSVILCLLTNVAYPTEYTESFNKVVMLHVTHVAIPVSCILRTDLPLFRWGSITAVTARSIPVIPSHDFTSPITSFDIHDVLDTSPDSRKLRTLAAK
jgi:hypothetical protein